MSNSKNYNSILFITTLSVYFGLVLVGATPSVLAQQAALTQKFEISNEREIEDDLDKNPDDDFLVSSIVDFVKELNEFSNQGVFDWNLRNTFQINNSRFCESKNSSYFIGSGKSSRNAYHSLDRTGVEIACRLFIKISDWGLGDLNSHYADFNLVLDKKDLNLTTEIIPNYHIYDRDVQSFVDKFTVYLTKISLSSKPTKKKIIAENTKITFENNQVFIVTNLPRAAIDELLADKDAK